MAFQWLFGNGDDPGVLGTGQYKAKSQDVNKDAFYDAAQSEQERAEAARLQKSAESRQAPTSQAVDPGRANNGQAVNAGYATTGPANLATAQNMNAANTGPANLANQTNINRQDEEFRNSQLGLVNNLQNTIAGNGPSLATSQLNNANAAAAASRMAANASQRGYGNSAATNRQAAYQQGAANQNNAMQSAQVRIQEQQNAQQALGQVLNSGRQQDIGVNTSQGQLAQQTNLANQDAQNQFQLQNAQFQQQANVANQQYQNQFNLANTGAQNQFQLQNTQNQQAVNELNANSANQFGKYNMDANNQFLLQKAQNQQSTNLANQEASLRQQGLNDEQIKAMLGAQIGLSQQELANKQAYEDLMVKQNLGMNDIQAKAYGNASQSRSGLVGGVMSGIGAAFGMSDENLKTNIKPVTLDSTTSSLKDKQQESANKSKADMNQLLNTFSNNNKNNTPLGAGAANLMTGIAKFASKSNTPDTSISDARDVEMSDENQKDDLLSGNEKVKQFLDNLNPVTFKYKDTSLPGTRPGTQLGILAQDMEKSDLGKQLVHNTENGKMVDFGGAIPALTASTALLYKEVKKLKGKK